jgi:hypothetical protein
MTWPSALPWCCSTGTSPTSTGADRPLTKPVAVADLLAAVDDLATAA